MTTSASKAVTAKPSLVFFHSASSGRCRRVEGFLAQVLQRRSNHDTFELVHVDADDKPSWSSGSRSRRSRRSSSSPTSGPRAGCRIPQGCRDIEKFLAPWLRVHAEPTAAEALFPQWRVGGR